MQGCGLGSSSERTRTAITGALKKKLKDLMGEFQQLRGRLAGEYRETVERRVFTVSHAWDRRRLMLEAAALAVVYWGWNDERPGHKAWEPVVGDGVNSHAGMNLSRALHAC